MKRIIISTTVLLIAACAAQAPTPEPGFEVVDYDRDGEIQLASGVDLGGYSKIMLETVSVEFRENWVEDQKRNYDTIIREKDEQRIKTGLSELVTGEFSRELSDRAYVISDESGAGVMRMTPRVVNLDVYAPDRVRDYVGYSLADSKGRMTIELDIHDSVSGELLATSSRDLEDPYYGRMERANSVSNSQAFRLMTQRWSDWLLNALENAGAGAPGR